MDKSFGERLREIRKLQGFTQERLANLIGVAKSTLTNYEKNKREPNILTLTMIAKTLGVTIDELAGFDYLLLPNIPNNEDEAILINNYRQLDQQGKDYINQTMKLALFAFRSLEWEADESKNNRDYDTEETTWNEQLRGLTIDEKVELYRKRLENEKRVSGSSTTSENAPSGEKAHVG